MVDSKVIAGYDDDADIINYLFEIASKDFDARINFIREVISKAVPEEILKQQPTVVEDNIQHQIKRIILPILDRNWREHIDDMAGFRQGIHLQSYAQANPLELYQREGYARFERFNFRVNREILTTAMRSSLGVQRRVVDRPNDNDPFKGLSTNQDQSTVRSNRPKLVNQGQFKNVGPNDACPCGSGKKFKFCHGLKR